MDEKILIVNASENNLDHLTLEIPKEKLVVLAGVSGSGKSTLAFDTLAAESSRQWQSNVSDVSAQPTASLRAACCGSN